MFKNFLFILVILLADSNNLLAQISQPELNEKAILDFNQSDKKLNLVYKQLVKKLSAEEKSLLVQAQRDWIKFRDSHCAFESSITAGGQAETMNYYQCLDEMTKLRIKDLESSIEQR